MLYTHESYLEVDNVLKMPGSFDMIWLEWHYQNVWQTFEWKHLDTHVVEMLQYIKLYAKQEE